MAALPHTTAGTEITPMIKRIGLFVALAARVILALTYWPWMRYMIKAV